MRFVLSVVAAVVLAVAGLAVVFHERAAAQQAAAAERDAAVAAQGAAAGRPERPATPSSALPSREAAPQPGVPASPILPPGEALPGAKTPPAQPAFYMAPMAGYGGPAYPAPQGGWFGNVGAPVADPETLELTGQDQQLEGEVQSLVRQLSASDDEKERGDLKQKLAAALEQQFDAQQKLRELEISRIEARVQKLRDLVRKRTDSRRKIIDNRYEQLLNDAEGLGWNTTPAGGQVVPRGLMRPAPNGPAAMPRAVPPKQGAACNKTVLHLSSFRKTIVSRRDHF